MPHATAGYRLPKVGNNLLGWRMGGDLIAALFRPAGRTGWRYPLTLDTLFQDAAGTTPVTAPGQPVGLVLDTSKGLALGPDLVTNGGFDVNVNGWSTTASGTFVWSAGTGVFTRVVDGNDSARQSFSTVSGRYYKITVTVVSSASNSARVAFNSGGTAFPGNVVNAKGPGTYSAIILATASTMFVVLGSGNNSTVAYDNISVRELPGNHRTQSTALNRLTYGIHPVTGIRNLLTRTEEFDNAAWTKVAAPTVTADGDAWVITDASTSYSGVRQTFTINTLLTYSVSIDIKKTTGVPSSFPLLQFIGATANRGIILNTSTGEFAQAYASAASDVVVADEGEYWRLSFSSTGTGSTSSLDFFPAASADGTTISATATGSATVKRPQLEVGPATAYQRVGSAFDVTEAGVSSIPYLAYNGSNSSMATASFAWGSDKATVCVGVRKNSDAGGFGVVLGFGNALNGTTPGEFAVVAPDSIGQPNYAFRSIGTSQGAAVAAGFAAPITSVVTGIGDISGDRATIRVNGAQVAQNSTNQGDGNYGTQQLFWGGRNGNSLFFNGREYPSIGINAALTASELAMVEAWVTARTGTLG